MARLPAPKHALVRLPQQSDEDDEQRPLSWQVLRRLLAYSAPHAKKRNLLMAMVVLRAIQYPAIGWATAAIISGPIAARDAHGIWLGTLGFGALVIWTLIIFHYRIRFALELAESVIYDLREAIVQKLFGLPLGFFQRQKVGRLISRLTSDLEAVRVGVKDVVFVGTVQLGSMLFSAVMMAYYDWLLFMVVALLVPVLTLIIGYFRSKLMDAYRAAQENFSRVTATVAESVSGIRITQGHGRGERNSEAFRVQIEDHAGLNVYAARRAAVMLPLLELNGQLFLALLLTVGGYRALHGSVPLDVLVQFFFLSSFFFNPISIIGNQYNQALTAMAGAERVFALLDSLPGWQEAPDAGPIGRIQGKVELSHVSFGYDPARLVLHDIDLTVEPGQTVALVGPTGSGKTSLLALIAKFYQPTSGEVRVDGVDLRQVSADSLRSQIGTVQQNNFLFTGSVLENVRVGRPGASDSQVHAAAGALDVLSQIEDFPAGWETELGERGIGLSLGQRQLVCFARAMLADPRILLLDEATSALDPFTERRLQHALALLLHGRTSFVVAHRLSTIRHADQVWVLEAGRVVERGTHDSLLRTGGKYSSLYAHFVS